MCYDPDNPETAELVIYWHHAPEQPVGAGPFAPRHVFDKVPGGYVYRATRGAKKAKKARA